MPIQFNKTPFTLQEKIDKAMDLSYQLKVPQDADFLRGFIMELIEKAYRKLEDSPRQIKPTDNEY